MKKVRLCGHFVPFDVHQLPRKFNEHRLQKDPVLHIYWIDSVSTNLQSRKILNVLILGLNIKSEVK